jgi:aminopeptidase N
MLHARRPWLCSAVYPLAIAALGMSPARSQAPIAAGIARDLAVERAARVTEVSYRLEFDLRAPQAGAGRREVLGVATLSFRLPEAAEQADLVLDFGEDCTLEDFAINGIPADPVRRENHVVLPGARLVPGLNSVETRFAVPVAASGTPLTVYRDPTDGREYWYTLTVPADAHRLYPCFDQPDLKARFDLVLVTPTAFVAVSNGDEIESVDRPRQRQDEALDWVFATTEPISTYLFAFAAGPFAVVADKVPGNLGSDPERRMRMFVRDSKLEDTQADLLFGMHRDALAWLSDYFGISYPFGKLDFVLLPGFPYGGMEHAGAIFYRETALSFDHEPTEGELIRRSTLVYHEVSHQWFGNLVTMQWFDDLWLKEGFATFVAYTLLEALEPGQRAWLRFHQRVKPRAYEVDRTRGTVPILQELGNLADAKSAYGPIVYNKAPAVLRQLQAWIGAQAFQEGMRTFLEKHRYANATWEDLVTALQERTTRDSALWSDRWIKSDGLPRVSADWEVGDDGMLRSFEVQQEAIGGQRREGAERSWPLDLEVLLFDDDLKVRQAQVVLEGPRAAIGDLVGTPAPAGVLLDPRDIAYGLLVLDPTSTRFFSARAHDLADPLQRAVAFAALRETLRAGHLAPTVWIGCLERAIAQESDPATFEWLLARCATTLTRYLTEEEAAPVRRRLSESLLARLSAGAIEGRELETFRFLARYGDRELVTPMCRALLLETLTVPGLKLGIRDRFLAAASVLAATGEEDAIARLERSVEGEDVAKAAYLARAATPDPERKRAVFASFLPDAKGEAIPEQWIQDALEFFHWPGQSSLTMPFLRPALDQVEAVKRARKIFFMPAWIDAFVNGHSTPEALAVVESWRAETKLDPDVEQKLLQSLDELELTVEIRSRD